MSGWDGRPVNPGENGWHWVCNKPVAWLAEWQLWSMPAAYISPDTMAERASVMGAYEGPLVTPAQHAAEVEQLQTALKAATQALHWCAENACTAGMSWSGMNIVGDKKSIDYVREAVHYYGQLDALRAAWKDRTAADVAVARREEREACATEVEVLAHNRGRPECCGHGVGGYSSPPECCGDPDLMISASDAAAAIRARGGSDAEG